MAMEHGKLKRGKRKKVDYEHIPVGELRLGPTNAIKVLIVKFRDIMIPFKAHIDIRTWKYMSTKKDFGPTIRGVTVTFELLKYLYNYINALPTDLEYPSKLTEIKRWPRDSSSDIVLQLGVNKGVKVIDIRQFLLNSVNGYRGFTIRGIQFSVDNRPAMLQILEDCIYKYEDMELSVKVAKNTIATKGIKEEDDVVGGFGRA